MSGKKDIKVEIGDKRVNELYLFTDKYSTNNTFHIYFLV